MGYVGTAPLSGDYRKLDDISSGFDGSETEFTLQVGSANVTPPKETTMLISVGGILQEPVSAYTVSGSTLTFTAAPASGADFFGILLGDTLDVGTPSDGTVTGAKVASAGLLATDIKIGEDSQTMIDFETANEIHFDADNAERVKIDSTGLNIVSGSLETATIDYTDGDLAMTIADGGGVTFAQNATFSGIIDITDTTDSSDDSGDTGALRVEGGASIAKKLYVGTDLDVDGTAELDNITVGGAQGSDGQVLTSTGSGVGWESVAAGIQNADRWRLPGGFNGSENPITSNWVRVADDEADYGEIGTQVYKHDGSTTYDGEIRPSGTFTFPSTGMWLVTAYANCVTASSTADNQSRVIINVSLDADAGTNGDGATYTQRAAGLIGLYSTTGYGSSTCQAIIDVTNKTNVAVQMGIADQAAGTYSNGSTSRNETGMVFLRIGDT